MACSPSARIHPTALVSSEADLADDVQIGAYAILEGEVHLGPGCQVRPYAHLIGPLKMGQGNQVFTGVILGEQPQHLRYDNEPTRLEIGEGNVFREHVTVHRGTSHSWVTRIGSHNYFMAGSHVAHDCVVGDRCILANGALLAGHCVLEDSVYVSGNAGIHQFTRVGRLSMLSGCSIATKDMPPFAIQQGINCISGINVVGMHRAGMSHAQINAVRRAYHILFYEGHTLPVGMAQAERELGTVDAVVELLGFIRQSTRGISSTRERGREAA